MYSPRLMRNSRFLGMVGIPLATKTLSVAPVDAGRDAPNRVCRTHVARSPFADAAEKGLSPRSPAASGWVTAGEVDVVGNAAPGDEVAPPGAVVVSGKVGVTAGITPSWCGGDTEVLYDTTCR